MTTPVPSFAHLPDPANSIAHADVAPIEEVSHDDPAPDRSR